MIRRRINIFIRNRRKRDAFDMFTTKLYWRDSMRAGSFAAMIDAGGKTIYAWPLFPELAERSSWGKRPWLLPLEVNR